MMRKRVSYVSSAVALGLVLLLLFVMKFQDGRRSPESSLDDGTEVEAVVEDEVETGDMDAEPFSIAGGTYAKDVNNTLAFGGLFPGEEDTMHQADEYKTVDNLMKMARIYARAIYSICCE